MKNNMISRRHRLPNDTSEIPKRYQIDKEIVLVKGGRRGVKGGENGKRKTHSTNLFPFSTKPKKTEEGDGGGRGVGG